MSTNIVNTSIEKLIQHITHTQPGSENYKKFVKNVHSTFRFGKFGSTGQKVVLRKYQGLSEKFRLHTQDSKAEYLDRWVTLFMQKPRFEGSIPSHTRYDILVLILNLSESPLKTTYIPSTIFTQEKPKSPQFKSDSETKHNIEQFRVKEIVDKETNHKLIQELQSKQYWRQGYSNYSYLNATEFDKNDSCTLGPSLAKHHSQDERYLFYDPTLAKYITELDSIREVKLNALLMHLTEGAFKSILEFFCEYGNYVTILRTFSTRVCKESCLIYGQTTQAFAMSILKMIWKFDNLLANLEFTYHVNNLKSQDISIQNQQQHSSSSSKSPAYEITYKILTGLFNELVRHQMGGSKSIFLMLGEHFDNSLVPFTRIIDEWISSGVINDPADEFFIVKNPDINILSSEYWSEMYKIRETKLMTNNLESKRIILPDFLENFASRILFAGKAQEFNLGVDSLSLFDFPLNNKTYDKDMIIEESFNNESHLEDEEDLLSQFSDKNRQGEVAVFETQPRKEHDDDEMEDEDEYEMEDEDDEMDEDDDKMKEIQFERDDEFEHGEEFEKEKEIQFERNDEFEHEEEFEKDKENIINNDNDDKEDIINNKNKDEGQQVNFNNCYNDDSKLPELLKIENLFDLNEIINDFPKTTSFLFPLLNLPLTTNETNEKNKDEEEKKDTSEKGIDERMNNFLIFQPFNERFRERYDEYLQPRYVRIGQQLHDALVDQCQFWRHIGALSGFYFMQQGESMHRLCDTLFEKIDKGQMWYDTYILNELILDILRNFKWLDRNSITFWVDDKSGSMLDITTVRIFEKIYSKYHFPWPLNNILSSDALQLYGRIFVFLLQIKRAKYLLERLSFSRTVNQNEATILFYGVRMKLIWFLNTIWDYTMRNILLAETENFRRKLQDVFDIDEMIALHDHYIQIAFERCILGKKTSPIHKSILDVLDLAIRFSTFSSSDSDSDSFMNNEEEMNDPWNRLGVDGLPLIPTRVDYQDFLEGLSRIDKEFNRHKDFISNAVQGIARVGGFWWFDALAYALG
ncbi:11717_t:CDS:10 [Diversispora eburnea]|uniref:Spindle pole body component n=1 Tax=Diversispora eburnea TaxID=1213867 RepID=A0A9N8V3M5_9GLOM|nr:11717_t:CDS:10 [Diversispora eburnea]